MNLPSRGRILFTCCDFSIGGHSSHSLNFGRALRKRGHRVGVLATEPFGELYADFKRSLDFVEILRRGIETRAGYLRRLVQRVERFRPDVIVNNAVPMVQAALPLLPENVQRGSVVHNVVEYEARLGVANGASLDWVVAVSDNVREMVDRVNGCRVPVATIPVGVESPRKERVQEKPGNPLRLIYVGRIERQKNLPGLLDVLTALHSAHLPFFITIVGDGTELPAVRARAHSSPFAGQIKFVGALPQREVARLLQEHDFLLMTSHYEGTPHAMLEAMAHGLVVLASRLPGATDRIITDGVDGFLCDREAPKDYVNILQRFVDEPGGFEAVSSAARRTVLSSFSADALVEQYESLFESGRASTRRTVENSDLQFQVPSELQLNFPGIILQAKHRVADIWRLVARGRRPVSPECSE